MFEVQCSAHGSPVLLPASRIASIRNTVRGIVVEWQCWCGARGHTTTGRLSTVAD